MADVPTVAEPPQLLTAHEVAALLRVSRSTVTRLSKNGGLHAIRIGTVLRFRADEVMALVAAREEGAA